jgi:hypothetical protein
MEDDGIFYGHLEYLRTFGIFYDHLVHFVFIRYIFSGFGIMHRVKSGNPVKKTKRNFPLTLSCVFFSNINWCLQSRFEVLMFYICYL